MSGTHTYFELLGGGKNIIKNKFELDESRRGVSDLSGGIYRLYYNPVIEKHDNNSVSIEDDNDFNPINYAINPYNGRSNMFNSVLNEDNYNYFMQKVYEHSPPRWPFFSIIQLKLNKNIDDAATTIQNEKNAVGIIVRKDDDDEKNIFIKTDYVITNDDEIEQWWEGGDTITDNNNSQYIIRSRTLVQTYYMHEHLDLAALVPKKPSGTAYPLYISNNNTAGIDNAFQALEVYNAADTRMVNAQNGQLETISNPLNPDGPPISYRDGNNLLMQPEFRDFTTMYKYCALDQNDSNRRFNSLPLTGDTNSIEHALSIISDDRDFTCARLTNENRSPPLDNKRPVWDQCKNDINSNGPTQIDINGASTCPIADDALEFARKTKNQVKNRNNLEEHIVRWSEQNPTRSMYKKRYGKKKPQTQRTQNQNGNALRTMINNQVSINQHAFQKRVNTVHGRVNLSNDFYLSKNNMHRLVAGGLRNLFHRRKRNNIIDVRQERFTFYRTTPIQNENTNTFTLTIRFAELKKEDDAEGSFTHFLQLVEAQPISLQNDESRFHVKGVVNIENPQQYVKMRNKYNSEVKHWISSGNTGGTYGVPALCAGANIYRKGGTRPSKRVKNSGKYKQCQKLQNVDNIESVQKKKQALEEFNLRQCNNVNFNDMYKASNFKDFEDNRYRAYTIFEALDIVCVPHILQGGGLSKEGANAIEQLTLLERLILQYTGFENINTFLNYANTFRTFTDFSEQMKNDGYYDNLTNSYPDVRQEFEAFLLNLLINARFIAKNEGKSNVTGTHILQALYSSDDSEAYKKRINNASDDEVVVQVTRVNTGEQQHGLYKYSFTKNPEHHFAIGDLIQIKPTDNFENEVSFLLPTTSMI